MTPCSTTWTMMVLTVCLNLSCHIILSITRHILLDKISAVSEVKKGLCDVSSTSTSSESLTSHSCTYNYFCMLIDRSVDWAYVLRPHHTYGAGQWLRGHRNGYEEMNLTSSCSCCDSHQSERFKVQHVLTLPYNTSFSSLLLLPFYTFCL